MRAPTYGLDDREGPVEDSLAEHSGSERGRLEAGSQRAVLRHTKDELQRLGGAYRKPLRPR